jgi:CRISPR-associated protein Cas6
MSQDYWQENTPKQPLQVPDDVVDMLFSLKGRTLPVDHAEPLARALLQAAPWLESEPCAGIHSIHVAGSQNGWQRPEADSGQPLMLSRRTKLGIRIPKSRAGELRAALEGRDLDVAGHALHLDTGKERLLSRETTLFSRAVCASEAESDRESDFLAWAARTLAELDIRIRKALCGKAVRLQTQTGARPARSLMLADLSFEESVRLQQRGLGSHRMLGCGLFIPHKGIDAVNPAKG